MLSIIIPTLNEEEYLPALLESIKKQDFTDYEIIVADAGSKDKTVEIAKKYGCQIVLGERGLPANSRNKGAKIAKGDILLFLDADVILPPNFLKNSMQEFNLRKLGIASFCVSFYPKKIISYFLVNIFYNKFIILMEKILPYSAIGIIIKKNLFNQLKGYDETIKLSEDYDLGRRAVKYEKFGIIKSADILTSNRRFVKDGWLVTISKLLLSELCNIFIGPVRSDIFKYKFNHYKKGNQK